MDNIWTTMERRCSRRSFTAQPIAETQVKVLEEKIAGYNAETGLHMQLVLNDPDVFKGFRVTYGMFRGVRNYIALVGKKDDADRMEKEGYYGEKLVLLATEMGLSTCWIGTSYDKTKCTCSVADDEELDLVIAIGYGEEKQGFKENMMKNMLARGAKAMDALMEVTGEQPEWFSEGMRAVMMAPTARNSRPFVFSCHNAVVSVRANGPAERVMVDIGIVKLHFELGAGGGKWSWGDKQTFQKT